MNFDEYKFIKEIRLLTKLQNRNGTDGCLICLIFGENFSFPFHNFYFYNVRLNMIRTNSLNKSVSSKGTMLTFKSLYKATPHTRIRGLSNIPNFHSNEDEDFPSNLSIA